MKLTTLFMLAAIFAMYANEGYSQKTKITLEVDNMSVAKVIEEIESTTDFRFVYNVKDLDVDRKVSIKVANELIGTVLEKLFSNTKTTYLVKDTQVILKEKVVKTDLQDLIAVKGTVTDVNGDGIPGVTVLIEGTTTGVYADFNGNYTIHLETTDITLSYSAIGFATKKVTLKENETTVNVTLSAYATQLDDVMVTAYGNTTKRETTGSVSKVSASKIELQPVSNPLQALQGQVAGLTITQTSGLPGAGVRVNIRGINSLLGSTTPLYVINGVPYSGDPVTLSASSGQLVGNPAANGVPPGANPAEQLNGGGESPLNFINPQDIESIEVLKDADATALYGSRAANGVIMITTKRGKAGKATFNVNTYTGMSQIARKIPVLNTEEYLALRRKAFETDGIEPNEANAPDLTVWDQNANHDFQKQLAGNTAIQQMVNASLSGGNERVNFLLSGTFDKQSTVFTDDSGQKRLSFNSNINYTSLNDKLRVNISTIYSSSTTELPGTDYFGQALSLPPNYPLRDENGDINYTASLGITNPLTSLHTAYKSQTNNLISNLQLTYDILSHLTFRTSLGYTRTDNQSSHTEYSKSIDPAFAAFKSIFTRRSQNISENFLIEPQLNYKRSFGKNAFDILLGGTWQQNKNDNPYFILARDYTSDLLVGNLNAAGNYTVQSTRNEYRYQSVFAKLNYTYNSKYIINLNFRRDGSSLFAPKNRYGNFGSVAGAWVFSEEALFKDKLLWFSFGKLRASYGVVGSDNASAYAYVPLYNISPFNYNGSTALQPSQIANPDYQWENTKKLEVALETGFFNNRLLVTGAWYRNRSDNQLVQFPISGQAGFTSYQANIPALIENSGLEFTLNSTNIATNNVSWSTDLNIAVGRNKLVKYDGIENTAYANTYIVGEPISTLFGFQYGGIDPDTNLPYVEDLNEDGFYTNGFFANDKNGDYINIGNAFPDFTGGLSNTVRYKGLQLDVLLQFSKGLKNFALQNNNVPGTLGNVFPDYLNKLKGLYANEEDFALLASDNFSDFNKLLAVSHFNSSDAGALEDASYIRLQNISLAYNLPVETIEQIGMSAVRVYLRGQNLLTLTKYTGADPETGPLTMPPLRTVTVGIQFGF